MGHVVKGSIFVALFLFPLSAFSANPTAPIQPGDNIQDPGALTTPWGGCGPTDTNCYVTLSTGSFSTVTVSGNSQLGTGASTTNTLGTGAGATNTIGNVTGSTTINGSLTTGGAQTNAGTVTNTGNTVIGDATVDTLTVNATSTFTAPFSATGAVTLGDAAADVITVNGTTTFNAPVTFTTAPTLPLTNNMLWIGNGSNVATAVAASGDVTTANTGAFTIANNAVTSAKILDGEIVNADVFDDTLNFTKLSDTLTLDASTDIAASGTNVLSITNAGTGLSFRVNDDGTTTDTTPFVIDASGNVGVGTTGPVAKFHIADEGNNAVLRVSRDHVIDPAYIELSNTNARSFLKYLGNYGLYVYDVSRSAYTSVTRDGKWLFGDSSVVAVPGSTLGSTGNLAVGSSYWGTAAPSNGAIIEGNVGIGTNAPASRLQVGDGTPSSSNFITLGKTEATTESNLPFMGAFNLSGDGVDLGIGATSTSGKIHFFTGNATAFTDANVRMSIDTAGNVGVGTTTPDARMTLQGNYNGLLNVYRNADVTVVGAAAADIQLGALNGTTKTPAASIVGQLNNPATTGELSLYTRTAGALTEKVRVDSAGSVGIGTPTPGAKLHVAGGNILLDNNGFLNVKRASDNAAIDVIGIPSGSNFTRIKGSDGVKFVNTGNAEWVTILNSGNVGIGTTNPDRALHVQSSGGNLARFTTSDYVSGASGSGLLIDTGAATGNTYTRLSAYSAGFSAWNNLILQEAGNVGIGTTAPTQTLDVRRVNEAYGTAAVIGGQVNAVGTSAPALPSFIRAGVMGYGFHNYTSSSIWNAGIFGYVPPGGHTATAGVFYAPFFNGVDWTTTARVARLIGADNVNAFVGRINQGTQSVTRTDMYIDDTTGYMGVGTSGPAAKLEVEIPGAAQQADGLLIDYPSGYPTNSALNITMPGYSGSARNLIQASSGAANSSFIVRSDGNVGIGNTNPNSKLDISGIDGSTALFIRSSDAGTIFDFTPIGGDLGGWLRMNNGAGTETIRLASGTGDSFINQGNFGVGTNLPNTLLHVKKDQTAKTELLVDNQGASNASTIAAVSVGEGGVGYGTLRRYRDGSGKVQVGNIQAAPLTLMTNDTDHITITAGGRVGVGTADPGTNKIMSTFDGTGASVAGLAINDSANAGSGAVFTRFQTGGTTIGSITNAGSSSVAYNTTSDRRKKENIVNTKAGLDLLMNLPVRDFSYIDDPNHAVATGFIAQELHSVFPGAVSTNGDDGVTPLDATKDPWAVDYGRVTPLIVKAVQDLNMKTEELARTDESFAVNSTTSDGSKTFVGKFLARMVAWFANTTNGIGVLVAQSFNASERICVDGECLTAADVRSLKALAAAGAQSLTQNGTGNGNGGTPVYAPTIAIQGNNPSVLAVNDTYVDLGAVAKNTAGGDISYTIQVDGVSVQTVALDTSADRTYVITYQAEEGGVVVSAERTVIIGSGQPATSSEEVVQQNGAEENSTTGTGLEAVNP